jgi:uncharacterized membrane protein YkoI
MVRSHAFLIVLATGALSLGPAGSAQAFAYARDGTEPGPALDASEAPAASVIVQLPNRRGPSLAEAIVSAQNRYPGRVVRAQTIPQGNGSVHEIRIIGNDGVVHTVRVDARTGVVQ